MLPGSFSEEPSLTLTKCCNFGCLAQHACCDSGLASANQIARTAFMQQEQHRNHRRGHDQEGTEDSKSRENVQWLANGKSGSIFQT